MSIKQIQRLLLKSNIKFDKVQEFDYDERGQAIYCYYEKLNISFTINDRGEIKFEDHLTPKILEFLYNLSLKINKSK